jgi:hypothetical protein
MQDNNAIFEKLFAAHFRGLELIAHNTGIRVNVKEACREYGVQAKAPSRYIKTRKGKRRYWPYLTKEQKRQAIVNAVLREAQS